MAGTPHIRSSIVPVQLVYSEAFATETAAVTRERQLKRWSHGKTQALVEGNIRRVKRLRKRRSQPNERKTAAPVESCRATLAHRRIRKKLRISGQLEVPLNQAGYGSIDHR